MEGKKSFLLYCDQIGLFEQLPDEQAGKLIKLIFAYVNDQEPVMDDLLLKVAFEPIKLQLKRDLKGWNNIVERNRANGAKGGRPPKPKEPTKPSGLNENPDKPKKADKDTDTVNDSVTVNDTNTHIPTLTQFLDHGRILCDKAGLVYKNLVFPLEQKYQTWKDAGWKDGHGKEIKNWKNKLGNTISYLKPIINQSHGTRRDEFAENDEILRRKAEGN